MSEKVNVSDDTQSHELDLLLDVVYLLGSMEPRTDCEARLIQRIISEYRSVLIKDYNIKF